jgi:transcription initiation factor TFIIIB Brf1 subunit/transcription initiation factor TFIIB
MIEDIVSAAIEWDDVNGGERTKKYKKKIENKITKLESILHTVSNEDNLSKVLSKIRKYKKNQKTGPKIGFNNKAYRSIQNNFHFNFKGIDNEVKSLILKTRERGDLDDQLYAEMLEIYEKNIDLFHGRNPKIVAAGIFFFLSIKENLAFDVDEISSMMNVSKASISDIERMISRKLQGQENDSRN